MYTYINRSDYTPYDKGVSAKKSIPITHNLRVLKTKTKDYSGKILHNFMLEEVSDIGPSNVAKFGRYVINGYIYMSNAKVNVYV